MGFNDGEVDISLYSYLGQIQQLKTTTFIVSWMDYNSVPAGALLMTVVYLANICCLAS